MSHKLRLSARPLECQECFAQGTFDEMMKHECAPQSAPYGRLRIKTEMPGPHRMDQLITTCDKAACDESAEYVLAATLTGAADEAGVTPDGDNFETRCNQRKMFIGRVIEIIRERDLLSSTPERDTRGEWRVDDKYIMKGSEQIGSFIAAKLAATAVSDHTLAASVPKLVEALKGLGWPYPNHDYGYCWCDARLTFPRKHSLVCEAARAALASAQIQEKQ